MPDKENSEGTGFVNKFFNAYLSIFDKPVTLFREKFLEPIRGEKKHVYYHRRYRRVPTIDECEVDDPICFYEANEQYKRDKMVDSEILVILRQRRLECELYHGSDADKFCAKVKDDYEKAETNWFVKYGDMGASPNVIEAYYKQVHRMLWERRHGPVGTGMKTKSMISHD